jgi:hypothetical protein
MPRLSIPLFSVTSPGAIAGGFAYLGFPVVVFSFVVKAFPFRSHGMVVALINLLENTAHENPYKKYLMLPIPLFHHSWLEYAG